MSKPDKPKPDTKSTLIEQKGLTKEALSGAIIALNGNINNIAKHFGYKEDSRSTIYKLIAKYDLNETLKTARGYENRLNDLIGEIAIELTLDTLLKLKPGNLQKQDVVLLIFILKSCAGFIEAKVSNDSLPQDDSSINNLIRAIELSREALKAENDNG